MIFVREQLGEVQVCVPFLLAPRVGTHTRWARAPVTVAVSSATMSSGVSTDGSATPAPRKHHAGVRGYGQGVFFLRCKNWQKGALFMHR